jgi:alpha-L-arabinofuranosidase
MILKVVNMSSQPQETDITLDGIGATAPEGTAFVLTSSQATDENSFAEPTRVLMRTESVIGLSPPQRRTFPPHSLTILRIKAK